MKRPGRTTETYEGSDLLEGNRRAKGGCEYRRKIPELDFRKITLADTLENRKTLHLHK